MTSKHDNTIRAGIGLLLAFLLGMNLLWAYRLFGAENRATAQDDAYAGMALFTQALEQVREQYVDTDKVQYRELIQSALRGMLASLDAHSQFLDPRLYEAMKENASGQFGGLGITITLRAGILTIVAPMDDTPGFHAGLLPGDQIIAIEGESTEGLEITEASQRLRGEPGTKVTITLHRPETRETFDRTIERAVIEVSSVKDAEMLADGIGYLRVVQFSETTADKLRESIDTLAREDLRGLVIDLRSNPGGLLSSAVDVSRMFLPNRALVVTTRGRDERKQQAYRVRGRPRYTDFPIVVLVNAGSASASEIVAGALQDHRRAVLVGETTFGKGSVQSVIPLGDGSALRLTTAHYYTPNNRRIHEKGIEPDIVVPLAPEERRALLRQRARREYPDPDAAPPDGNAVQDPQLERALDILHGLLILRG